MNRLLNGASQLSLAPPLYSHCRTRWCGSQHVPCHGTFGQFRTQLGSGGNGREQSGKSGAIQAGA